MVCGSEAPTKPPPPRVLVGQRRWHSVAPQPRAPKPLQNAGNSESERRNNGVVGPRNAGPA